MSRGAKQSPRGAEREVERAHEAADAIRLNETFGSWPVISCAMLAITIKRAADIGWSWQQTFMLLQGGLFTRSASAAATAPWVLPCVLPQDAPRFACNCLGDPRWSTKPAWSIDRRLVAGVPI